MWKNIICLFFLLLSAAAEESSGQLIKTRLDLIGGVAYPEFVHGGLRYQYYQRGQIELSYGGDMEFKPEIIRTYALNHMFHFGKKNFYSNRPAWYSRQGFTYITKTDESMVYKQSFLTLSLGYDFPINNWFGVNADMGLSSRIYQVEGFKDTGDPLQIDPRWYPGFTARIQIYFSL
jgi:hypothetical protein